MQHIFAKGHSSTNKISTEELFINNCGCFKNVQKDTAVIRPLGRKDYLLLFSANGKIKIGKTVLESGDYYLFLPNEKQKYTYLHSNTSLFFWIHFSGKSVKTLLETNNIEKGYGKCGDKKSDAETLLRMIIKSYTDGWSVADNYSKGLLFSLFSVLCVAKTQTTPFHKALAILNDFSSEIKISDLSEIYKMSEGNFIRQFKKYIGKTPLEYRLEKLIDNSKNMLVDTSLSVGEIAKAFLIEDSRYFSRLFKKKTGISPLEYRKNGGC